MPLIILGLITLTGMLIYAVIRYINSGEYDDRPVRERYPHIFGNGSDDDISESNDGSYVDENGTIHPEIHIDTDDLRGDIEHIKENIRADVRQAVRRFGFDLGTIGRRAEDRNNEKDDPEGSSSDDNTIKFPTDNVEAEKNKRNIH